MRQAAATNHRENHVKAGDDFFVDDGQPPLYRFRLLDRQSGIDHGVSTRRGGESRGPFRALNLARSVGDDPGAVQCNRRLLSERFGGQMVFLNQNHGTMVRVVDRWPPTDDGNADAVVTDLTGVYLVIQVADCQAIMVCDPVRRVVANIHCGWRGSVNGIIGRTLDTMRRRFGCRMVDCLAAIGPSLGPCCAEFVHYRRELPEAFWHFGDPHHRFDFWRISIDQLVAEGLDETRIACSGICSRCHSDRFYSYRTEKRTGRFAAVIGLT
jgi:YfiH family protein